MKLQELAESGIMKNRIAWGGRTKHKSSNQTPDRTNITSSRILGLRFESSARTLHRKSSRHESTNGHPKTIHTGNTTTF